MYEIRIHGRGGQGAKTVAQILAEAAVLDGKETRAFPEYGPERTGAPVTSYVRISDKPIKTYEPVTTPSAVLVLDETLVGVVPVAEGLSEKGILVINAKDKNVLKEKLKFNGRIIVVDAGKISFEEIRENRPNIPVLGAFLKASPGVINPETIEESIRKNFLKKIGKEKTEGNVRAFKKAYEGEE